MASTEYERTSMNFLRALNEHLLTHKQVQSPHKLPTLDDLKSYLENQFGQIRIKGNKTTVTVTLPRFDDPEIIDDRANRALRAFGLNYMDLRPGKPKATGKATGMTRQFTIQEPELNPAYWQDRNQKHERNKRLNHLLGKQDRKNPKVIDPWKRHEPAVRRLNTLEPINNLIR